MTHRAYTQLTVKAYDDDQRIIEGWATTPEPDRVEDVVDPFGAKFAATLPLLWMHRHDSPVGTVKFGKATKDGIPFTAQLPIIAEAGRLKERVDEAWQSVKAKLVRSVSIGFRVLKDGAEMLPTGGIKYTNFEIYELSLVTIPAHPGATITEIKAFDKGLLSAADGNGKTNPASATTPARVEGKKTTVVTLAQAKGPQMKLAESLKGYQDALAAKKAERLEVVNKSLDAGRTADEAERESITTLNGEIKALTDQIELVKSMIDADVASATPAAGNREATKAAGRVEPSFVPTVKTAENGLALAQLVRIKYMAQGNPFAAQQYADAMKGSLDPRVVETIKAAVPAANTQNAPWAGNLIAAGGVVGDFVEFLRKQTILGKFGVGSVPALRNVPFDVDLKSQLTGGQGYWVGEGQAKPLTQWTYGSTKLLPLKVATIAAITEELLKRATPQADAMIRDELVSALRERLDTDFVDPAKAAVANISPASITNGVTPLTSTGDVDQDVRQIMAAFMAANNAPSAGVWILPSMLALAVSQMKSLTGEPLYPRLTMFGGELAGFQAIVSDYVPPDTVIFVNATDIYYGDEGGFQVDMSREASLEMADNPTHNSTTPTGTTSMVSMWQTNSVAFRAERYLNWAKRRPGAVVVLDGVTWGAPVEAGAGG